MAAAVLDVAESLGEPEPKISGGQVSKWERGDRNPGLYYRARLCLALECTPDRLGFPATPRLSRSIRGLIQRSQESSRQAGLGEEETNIAHVDMERLRATLTHLWPVDRPLLDGLDRAGRHLALRRDTEPPSAVVADLSGYLNLMIELLSRSQRPDYAPQLRRIAAYVGQNLAMAQWIAGDGSGTYRTYAIAESLARESRSGSTLGLILVDRSEMAGQTARTTDGWNEARDLADAAETAALMDSDTPPGILAWIYGERSGHRAELGDELGSGRDLERMDKVRLSSPLEALNVFSPSVGGDWVDAYHVRHALRLHQADNAISICTKVLSETDLRLIWQHSETLVMLAEAWFLKGDLGGASEQLAKAIPLLKSTSNARDLRGVHHMMNRMRQRWGRAVELRQLDELLRS